MPSVLPIVVVAATSGTLKATLLVSAAVPLSTLKYFTATSCPNPDADRSLRYYGQSWRYVWWIDAKVRCTDGEAFRVCKEKEGIFMGAAAWLGEGCNVLH